jgi:restriction system protein
MATKSGLPSYPEYFFPTLQVIRESGGSATIEEIEDGVSEKLSLSDRDLSVPHGDGARSEFQYQLAWVRTYLKKFGAITNSERGVWSLTDHGERMTEQEARDVMRVVHARNRQRLKASLESGEFGDELGLTDEEVERLDGGEEGWIERLLTVLGDLTPAAFERLAQRLLRESGFTKVEVTGRPSDGGIDGIGVLRVNLVSFQVLFQCKRWKGPVGAPVVRDFRGAMVGRADKGLIITTSSFTADARREATRDGAPAIDLIDGEMLCDLLKDRRLGVAVQMVEQIELDPAFFAAI